METVIPYAIEQCDDPTLKDNAIAAIYRGSARDQNVTLLACIQHNKKHKRMNGMEQRIETFKQWKQWFIMHV